MTPAWSASGRPRTRTVVQLAAAIGQALHPSQMRYPITTIVEGVEYTGTVTLCPVGRGKVMFEVHYGLQHHLDKSVFRDDDPKIPQWAEWELRAMVRREQGLDPWQKTGRH